MDHVTAEVPDAIRALTRRTLDDLEALSRTLAVEISTAEPAYRDQHVVPPDDLQQGCRSNLGHVLRGLAEQGPTEVTGARATGRRRAEQGVPLHAVLHAFRIGGRFIWQALLARADDELTRQQLLEHATAVWAMLDEYSVASTEAYRETVAERTRRDVHIRSALLTRLLEGAAGPGPDLWEIASMLQLPHRGHLLVVVAQIPSSGREPLPGIESRLRSKDVMSAWSMDIHSQVGVVALRPAFPVAVLCDELARLTTGPAGVSRAYAELRDTPAAFQQARLACAATRRGATVPTRYEDQPVGVLLASSPAAAAQLARDVFGPLLDLEAPDRELLLNALRTWFGHAGSTSAAAAHLHVHRNTLGYRLRRVEELTQRDLKDPAQLSELHLALFSEDIATGLPDG